MDNISLSFAEAVRLAAKQNYEYDFWNHPEDLGPWEQMKDLYIDEAMTLLHQTGENYLPDRSYNKEHPDSKHVHIVVKS